MSDIFAYRAPRNQQQVSIFLKNKPVWRMNEEISGISNEGKMVKNERENDSDFFQFYALYMKNYDNSFSILYSLTCLNKDTSVLLQVTSIWTS